MVGWTLERMFASLAWVGGFAPHARPSFHGLKRQKDHLFLEDQHGPRHLDIYTPVGEGPWPVVLYIHGGAFQALSKGSHWLMGLCFARRGYLVFSADYRLAPEHPFPGAAEDVCAAYRWVVENCARFGGDPSRIVVSGESAGANLVTSLAIAACFERPEPWARAVYDLNQPPAAVVPFCGYLQVSDAQRLVGKERRVAWFVRDRILDVEDQYIGANRDVTDPALDLANPLLFMEADRDSDRPLPPFFLSCGGDDPLLDDTNRLQAALQRRGVRHTSLTYEGGTHAFQAFIWNERARQCWRDCFAFLESVLDDADGQRAPLDGTVALEREAG
jgi:acetyl esterase